MKEIKVKSFECDEDLSKYVSSMLFDSGEEIARGVFTCDGEDYEVSLRICGEVSVRFKDDVYHRPSEFPDELVERIKEHPYTWDILEDDTYVNFSNWFEYIIDKYDGVVYEEDLSKATPDTIREDMMYFAKEHFGVGKETL